MAKLRPKQLIESLRTGDLVKVRAVIREQPDSARSPQAVGEAARLAWKEALELLLNQGADLNAVWRNYRPLHAVIQEKPHAQQPRDEERRLACLQWMLANGADPELLGGWPATRALITAAFVGETAFVTELQRAGAVTDAFVAAALGDVHHIEKTLENLPTFALARDPGGLTALHCAAGSRLGASSKKTQDALLAIAGLLVDRGADVKARVRSWAHEVDAVYFAVSSGQDEVFGLLLERGADATEALAPPVWSNKTALAQLALDRGANLDRAVDEGKPLLNQMIRWGQFKQALWLLDRGASPNVADDHGWTAVHQAASRGNENMLNAVLAAGGDATRKNVNGDTPLAVAQLRRRPKIIALLDRINS